MADRPTNYGGPSPIGPEDLAPGSAFPPYPQQPAEPPAPAPAPQAGWQPPGSSGYPYPQPAQPGPAGWQAPPPGQPAPSGYPPFVPPPIGAPWWQGRKPLLVTLGAAAAVLLVVGIVLASTLGGRGGLGGGGGSAGDTVKAYLEALARGDAAAALSFSDDEPASKEFLTDEILKQQNAKWPITNIRILSDDSGTATAAGLTSSRVHVAVNFGDKVSDVNMHAKKKGDKWRLEATAAKLETHVAGRQDAAVKTLTVFGNPVTPGVFYVFPGYIDWGSTNPYLSVELDSPLLDKLTAYDAGLLLPEFSVNPAGEKAVNNQIAQMFSACEKSNVSAPPPPCPLKIDPSNVVEGTVKWGPADLSDLKQSLFDPYSLVVRIRGGVKIPVSADTRTGEIGKKGGVNVFMAGTADLSKTPPVVDIK